MKKELDYVTLLVRAKKLKYIANRDFKKMEVVAYGYDYDSVRAWKCERDEPDTYIIAMREDIANKVFNIDSIDMSDKEIAWYYNHTLTEQEFIYFTEAFNQYTSEMLNKNIVSFVKLIKMMRFNKKEAKKIQALFNVLRQVMHDYEHDIVGEVEEHDEYYDYEELIDFFIHNII